MRKKWQDFMTNVIGDDRIFKRNLRAPIPGTWNISGFTAIKRKLEENLFFFKRDIEKTTKGYLLIPSPLFKKNVVLKSKKSCMESCYRTLRTDGVINRKYKKGHRTRNWGLWGNPQFEHVKRKRR